MRTLAPRLRPALALLLLAWFAQLCLPLVHARMMAAPDAAMAGWCGEPSRARAAAAVLPDEIRAALGLDGPSAEHLGDCGALCATGAAPVPAGIPSTVALRAAGLEAADPVQAQPRSRAQAAPPPSQGPPARA